MVSFFWLGANRSLKRMWLVLVTCSVSFPISFLCRLSGPESQLWKVKLLFLIATTKHLSPWANQNLASGRIYCHLLVRGNYLFLPFFGGMCFRGFVFWFGAKGILLFYLTRCNLSYKSVHAFRYFIKRGKKPLYLFSNLDQESKNYFYKGLDSILGLCCKFFVLFFTTLKKM